MASEPFALWLVCDCDIQKVYDANEIMDSLR